MVETLRHRMFPGGEDHDPLTVIIFDHRLYDGHNYLPVPREQVWDEHYSELHFHPDKQAEMDSDRLRWLLYNLDIANHAVQQWEKMREHHEGRDREAKLPYGERVKAMCLECRKGTAFKKRGEGNTEWHSTDFLLKYPDYPEMTHVGDVRCDAFELRRYQFNLVHGLVKEEEPDTYCSLCQARLRHYDSFKGAGDKGTCPNPTCDEFTPQPERPYKRTVRDPKEK